MTKREAKDKYFNLIKECYYREKPEGYTELHHICPKCLNLLSEEQNKLVALTYQEHLLAHYYLAVWFETEGLVYAFMAMFNNSRHAVQDDGSIDYERIRNKYSEIVKEKWQDPEFRAEQTERRQRTGQRPEFKEKIGRITKAFWQDPEYRAKQTENSRNRYYSNPMIKEKLRVGAQKYLSKPVVQLTSDGQVIREWKGATEAAKELGLVQSCIARCCSGQRKTAGGFVWKYKDNSTNN